VTEFKKCVKCNATTTYIYDGRPAWHGSADGSLCHACYCEKYRAEKKQKLDVNNYGGETKIAKEKIDLLEMKCANPMCSNRIYIAGSPKMSIDAINANCSDCQLVSTYQKKKEKATEVKRIIEGQLKLDTSLEKDSD